MEYALFNPKNMNVTSSDQSENFFVRQLFEWSFVQKCARTYMLGNMTCLKRPTIANETKLLPAKQLPDIPAEANFDCPPTGGADGKPGRLMMW